VDGEIEPRTGRSRAPFGAGYGLFSIISIAIAIEDSGHNRTFDVLHQSSIPEQ
jgi:hypothetical protein